MKKIRSFGRKTLNKFIVNISFKEELPGFDIIQASKFTEKIRDDYPDIPKLMLVPRLSSTPNLFGITPLTFKNNSNQNQVQIGLDFIAFVFNEYEKWNSEFDKIMKFLRELNEIVSLPLVEKFVMTYLDIFTLSTEKFDQSDFQRYFHPVVNSEWDLNYEDFYLGIVPLWEMDDEGEKKMVFRHKGKGKKKDGYFFTLESVFSREHFPGEINIENLKTLLDEGHNIIEHYFLVYFKDDFYKEFGITIDEY